MLFNFVIMPCQSDYQSNITYKKFRVYIYSISYFMRNNKDFLILRKIHFYSKILVALLLAIGLEFCE